MLWRVMLSSFLSYANQLLCHLFCAVVSNCGLCMCVCNDVCVFILVAIILLVMVTILVWLIAAFGQFGE